MLTWVGSAARPVAAAGPVEGQDEPTPQPEGAEDPVGPDDVAAAPVAEPSTAPQPGIEGAGPDEVLLTSGGLVRGLVTEAEPKSHVTIIVGGSGEVRRILWADVQLVERGNRAKEKTDPRSIAAPGRPRVHIDIEGRGSTDVRLFEVRRQPDTGRLDGGYTSKDVEVCAAPCNQVVDGREGQQFAIGGRGISRSLTFTIIDAPAELKIGVRPGRRALMIAGWVLASVGAAAVIGGATTLTLADDDDDKRKGGGYAFLAGLPLVAGGGVMIAFGRTRVRLGDRTQRKRR